MRRLSLVLILCVFVVGISLFFSRTRELAHRTDEPRPAATEPQDEGTPHVTAISAIRKTSGGDESAAPAVTAADRQKAQVLEQILGSKNDNDPRLDREFNALTAGAKALFQQHYAKYAPEKRNERGTIVFLLGRNLTSASDFGFLHQVLSEPACLSLADCSKSGGSVSAEDLHYGAGDEVTLAYPQLVALKAIEGYLWGQSRDAGRTAAALRELENARHSPVGKVARVADDITRRYAQQSGRH